MSLLTRYVDVANNPKLFGPIITATAVIGFFGTCPIWYICGKQYEKIMKKKAEAKELEEAAQAEKATAA